MAVRVEFTVPDELYERLESARGHEPRASFVKRALESALAGSGAPAEVAPVSARPSSAAPTRTPASATDAYVRARQKSYGLCPDCGKANGVHKGDCPQHPRAGR